MCVSHHAVLFKIYAIFQTGITVSVGSFAQTVYARVQVHSRYILTILVKSITNIYYTHGNALSRLYYGDVCNLTKIACGIYSVIRRNIMRQWNKSAFSHHLRAQWRMIQRNIRRCFNRLLPVLRRIATFTQKALVWNARDHRISRSNWQHNL